MSTGSPTPLVPNKAPVTNASSSVVLSQGRAIVSKLIQEIRAVEPAIETELQLHLGANGTPLPFPFEGLEPYREVASKVYQVFQLVETAVKGLNAAKNPS